MSRFQSKIADFIKKRGTSGASTWEIAQTVFPKKWRKRFARGALIGHVDRVASGLPGVIRIPPKTRFSDATFYSKGLFRP